MEIPDLVGERLGDEEIRAGVSLGDEDAVFTTGSRTLLYRSEGILSDESITELPHDVERLDLSEGRRKTKFELTYVDGTESFTVPNNRSEKVLKRLLVGVLRVGGVVGPDESVRGVYRFSELTVIISDGRLVKHVGSVLWDPDYEAYPFSDVTGLAFEEGSVATQIVLDVEGRPQRIKAPNDDAPMLRQTLQQALFAYHDVDSLAALNDAVASEPEGRSAAHDRSGRSDALTLDDGIDPLVGGSPEESRAEPTQTESAGEEPTGRAELEEPTAGGSEDVAEAVSQADIAAIDDRLETLTAAVEKQNEVLEKQQRTIKQLIDELRQGR
jgi:hypothetical protein